MRIIKTIIVHHGAGPGKVQAEAQVNASGWSLVHVEKKMKKLAAANRKTE